MHAYTARGVAIQRLARQCEVSDYSMRMILRKAGVGPTHQRTSPENVSKVRVLWSDDVSVAEIARQLGIGPPNVRMIIASIGDRQGRTS